MMKSKNMVRDYIKFGTEHVSDILAGEKYQTVRYGWSDFPNPGDLVDLRDSHGDVFAEAEIRDVHFETVEYFASKTHGGHRDYESPIEMIQHMNQYYAENFQPDTEIAVIAFEVKHDGAL